MQRRPDKASPGMNLICWVSLDSRRYWHLLLARVLPHSVQCGGVCASDAMTQLFKFTSKRTAALNKGDAGTCDSAEDARSGTTSRRTSD